jgi:hypothetical protein
MLVISPGVSAYLDRQPISEKPFAALGTKRFKCCELNGSKSSEEPA